MSAADFRVELAKPLDGTRVKQRPNGRGGQLSYIETHDAIRAANEIFGFGNWGHEIVSHKLIDTVMVHNSDQKPGVHVGYVCVVKLTVTGCLPTSGVGYGDATEYRESGPVTAHELAAKEAESDALKRALKNFGDQFGLALYDKDAANAGHVEGQIAAGTPSSGGQQRSQTQSTNGSTITEPQQKRLFAISKSKNVDAETVKLLIKQVAGVDSSAEIPRAKYDAVIEAIEAEGVPF